MLCSRSLLESQLGPSKHGSTHLLLDVLLPLDKTLRLFLSVARLVANLAKIFPQYVPHHCSNSIALN